MHAADVSKCVEKQCECLCYKDVEVNICTNNVQLRCVKPEYIVTKNERKYKYVAIHVYIKLYAF